MAEPVVIVNQTPQVQTGNQFTFSPFYLLSLPIIAAGIAFLIYLKKRKVKGVIKLLHFLNDNFLQLIDYPENPSDLTQIKLKDKTWLVDKDNPPKYIRIKKNWYPCYIIHNEYGKPLNVEKGALGADFHPEVLNRLTDMSALKELLKPRIETPGKQMLLFIIVGACLGLGIGLVVGMFI